MQDGNINNLYGLQTAYTKNFMTFFHID